MKKLGCIILIFSVIKIAAQDSLSAKPKTSFGIEYNLMLGGTYGHGIYGTMIHKERHQITLGLNVLPMTNPFKDGANLGGTLGYDLYPNKRKNRLDLLFHSDVTYEKYKTIDNYYAWNTGALNYSYKTNSDLIMWNIGLGFNFKIAPGVSMKFLVSSGMFYYVNSNSVFNDYVNGYESRYAYTDFELADFEDFMINDLTARIGINYFFKKRKISK